MYEKPYFMVKPPKATNVCPLAGSYIHITKKLQGRRGQRAAIPKFVCHP
jgi:hypothetical protein